MFFKLRRAKIIGFRTIAFFLVALLSFFSYVEQARAGSIFSQEAEMLINALHKDLIKKRVCDNDFMCSEMLQTLTEGNKRIYLNMYGQTDTVLASYVVAFFIEKGKIITGGIPITLRVFPKPKTEYMGLKYAFGSNEYLIKLELNK